MTNKLSVVVTSYNYEQYIGETLLSLVNQTIKNLEIIVVDDGSKDNSVKVIQQLAQEYKNIHLYQHPNGVNKGIIASTKLGIEKANGQYVAFCESDDYWDEKHAEYLIRCIEKSPEYGLIFNKIKVISCYDEDFHDVYSYKAEKFLLEHNGKNIFTALDINYMPTFSAACIRRELLLNCDFNAFWPQYLDFWLWRQLCLKYPICYESKAITYWRKHTESYDFKEGVADIRPFLEASNKLLIQKMHLSFKERLYLFICRSIIGLFVSKNSTIRREMRCIYRFLKEK